MKRLSLLLLVLIAACAPVNTPGPAGTTGNDDANPIYQPGCGSQNSPITNSNAMGCSNAGTNIYTYITKEKAGEDLEYGFSNFVYTGTNAAACLGTTGAGLTMTPTSCIGYNAGLRGTETGAITFANNSTTWVAMDENTSGSNGGLPNFARVTGTHYLTDSIDASQPSMVSDSQLLMKVVTSGGAITAVTDLRNASPSLHGSANGVLFCGRMKCDGATDDSAALQNCMNQAALTATVSTTVQMPAGVCKLNAAVSYTGIIPFTLQGSTVPTGNVSQGAAGTVLQADTGLTTQMLTFTGGASPLQGMSLRDFTLDCNSIATNGLKIGDHGLDYSHISDVEVKKCTGDGITSTTSGRIVNLYAENLISHDNTNRGMILDGTINNATFVNSKFFYNYQAGGGSQVQCQHGSSRTGPVTFVSSDIEPNPGDAGTDIDYLDEGCITDFIGGYFETHGAAASTGISIQANTTGETIEVNVINGFSNGGTTSDYFFSLPGAGSTSNVLLNVVGMHLKGYLCGAACTSTRLNPTAAAPISGLGGTLTTFVSMGNDWYPDTVASLNGLEGGAMTGRSGRDMMWPDSTSHRWKINNNNVAALDVETYAVGVIGSAPTCNAAQEGTFYTATDCNAGCSAGGTCTTGAATHCGLYCNGSAWKETGI